MSPPQDHGRSHCSRPPCASGSARPGAGPCLGRQTVRRRSTQGAFARCALGCSFPSFSAQGLVRLLNTSNNLIGCSYLHDHSQDVSASPRSCCAGEQYHVPQRAGHFVRNDEITNHPSTDATAAVPGHPLDFAARSHPVTSATSSVGSRDHGTLDDEDVARLNGCDILHRPGVKGLVILVVQARVT
jgi:hypothetical protein